MMRENVMDRKRTAVWIEDGWQRISGEGRQGREDNAEKTPITCSGGEDGRIR
jgi:hypothetical protein